MIIGKCLIEADTECQTRIPLVWADDPYFVIFKSQVSYNLEAATTKMSNIHKKIKQDPA